MIPSEIVDSSLPDQIEYETNRADLWRIFCEVIRSRNDHVERLQVACDILGAMLDSPALPSDVLLEIMLAVAAGPRGQA